MTVLGEPSWFASGGRMLEGWVHRPEDGRSVGAIVIAPSLAREHIVTYRALRTLAVTAARLGWVVVRFNWSGQGDSEPVGPDADLVEAWLEDLASAVGLAKAASGAEHAEVIGLRLGAAVAGASQDPAIGSRLLWEPQGGRAFVREQSALFKVRLPGRPAPEDGGVELCSLLLDGRAAASLRKLPDPAGLAPELLPERTRVVREQDDETVARLYQVGPATARTPIDSLRALIGMLERGAAVELPAWRPLREIVVIDPESGAAVRQSLVEVGAARMPGIYSVPADGETRAAAALMVPLAGEAKGLDRIWAPASRRLAGRGVPNLRADRRGIGDAADPDELVEPNVLSSSGAEDVAEMFRWLSERSSGPITTIGACSGAWLAAHASARATLPRVVMINNVTWLNAEGRYRRLHLRLQNAPLNAVLDGEAGSRFLRRAFRAAKRTSVWNRIPYGLRLLGLRLARIELVEPMLAKVPSRTSVRLILGEEDRPGFLSMDGDQAQRRLRARGRRVGLDIDARLDHSLLSQAAYDAVQEAIDAEFFGSETSAGASAPARASAPAGASVGNVV